MNIKILGLSAIIVRKITPTAAAAVNPDALHNLTTAAVIGRGWIAPRRYFYVNSTYYVYAPGSRDYVVVAAPSGAEQAVANVAPEPVVYPTGGQSVEQIDQDRYECHRWAMGESDFDPTRSQQEAGADQDRYNRALSACLTGRGYTVG